jgi:hypothetical protein
LWWNFYHWSWWNSNRKGKQNTAEIIAGCSEINTAAFYCDTLIIGGYNDWFLPSKDELNKLYLNKDVIGGFAESTYWSSSELESYPVWGQEFSAGFQFETNKFDFRYVRAVRYF